MERSLEAGRQQKRDAYITALSCTGDATVPKADERGLAWPARLSYLRITSL
jgi:hypothetical protein